ncbi:MAG: mannose-6-phosphate isomerase, class I [Candidatus Binatia bacterium]
MVKLENTLLEYSWGSRTMIAEWLGRPSPSAQPQAEMWMGAHPVAPSLVAATAPGQGRVTLADRIAAAPAAELGEAVCRRFGGKLPFLLKVIAADSPLSLQAHPNREQAREGYAREEAAGVPIRARERNYKDENHKPEFLLALAPFDALCGFRPASESRELLEALGTPQLDPILEPLRSLPGPEAVRGAFERIITMEAAERPAFVAGVLAACRAGMERTGPWREAWKWAVELGERYPGDPGSVSSLLLNLIHLEAGETVFLPTGSLHTYLRGIAVEVMASSDNVLRGGLTPKHMDVPELLRVLDFGGHLLQAVEVRALCRHERAYLTPTADFRLSAIEVGAGTSCAPERRGPELLLCVAGSGEAVIEGSSPEPLSRGESLFVSAGEAPYRLSGNATFFRVTVGDLDEATPAAAPG